MNNYLNKTYIILDRELRGYFRTPLASIFLLVFLALSSGMTFFLGRLGRVLSWYDNEWGFANRMSDTASVIGKLI